MVAAYFPLAAMGFYLDRNSICTSVCVQSVTATRLLQLHNHLLLKMFTVSIFNSFNEVTCEECPAIYLNEIAWTEIECPDRSKEQ